MFGCSSNRSSSRNMPELIKLWTKKNLLIYGSRQVTFDALKIRVVVNLSIDLEKTNHPGY